MNLREFLFRNELTSVKLAKIMGCTKSHFSLWKHKVFSPNMVNLLKLDYLSKGELTLIDLASDDDFDDFIDWKMEYEKNLKE